MPEPAVIVTSLLVLFLVAFNRVLCMDGDSVRRGSQVHLQIIDGSNEAASNYHHLFVGNQR